jgi:hypothetical protein
MRKTTIFLIIAVWISILPYLGLGVTLRNTVFAVTGFIIIMVAYAKERDRSKRDPKRSVSINFKTRKTEGTLHSIRKEQVQDNSDPNQVVLSTKKENVNESLSEAVLNETKGPRIYLRDNSSIRPTTSNFDEIQ